MDGAATNWLKYSKSGRKEGVRGGKAERGKTKYYYIWRGMTFKRKFMHYAYCFIAGESSKPQHTWRETINSSFPFF